MPPSTREQRAKAMDGLRFRLLEIEKSEERVRTDERMRDRHIVRMIDELGMSRREIAREIGVAHNTPKAWYDQEKERRNGTT